MDNLSGAVNGVFQAGGLIGALASVSIVDTYGRRTGLCLASVLAVIGGALQAGATHIAMYITMRLISGIGVGESKGLFLRIEANYSVLFLLGALITLVPLYLAEVAAAQIRGRVVGTTGIMIGVGYAVASWIGFGFYFVDASNTQWRIPMAIQFIPPLLLAVAVWWLPESPRWLLLKDRLGEAHLMFKMAHSASHELEVDAAVNQEFQLLRSQILQEKRNAVGFKDLFLDPTLRKRTLLDFLTLFGGQAAGTQVINNYGPSLCAGLGYNTTNTFLMQCGWITTVIFGNIINTVLLDKFGRKQLLIVGFLGCVALLIGECVSVSQYQSTQSHSAAVAAVFFLYLVVAVYSSTLDATVYVYPSKFSRRPFELKEWLSRWPVFFLASILILSAAPTAFEQIKWKYFLVFVDASSAMVLVVILLFPETKQKTLGEISAIFGDYSPDPQDADKGQPSVIQAEDSTTTHQEEVLKV
ncbi:uncharacterized protein A1O9_09395 [Exophiala aquamarina CBS 119918]|uniref:Major facilitator superfamily (MFS) profile domain-containing protein n=1 Tax=Exophiala aquamarina CBS 119918 TaxID=1182545 RepID=A0A072P280_9EURO|nr:uncharacterized protein A1O9_09395 [Exophiala aquamarina CBS 119918]KEF54229.1 hypothetical protein A1O9_09395 [Exophiala aquamarina CBS 119918]